jgi:hypothetical protein
MDGLRVMKIAGSLVVARSSVNGMSKLFGNRKKVFRGYPKTWPDPRTGKRGTVDGPRARLEIGTKAE